MLNATCLGIVFLPKDARDTMSWQIEYILTWCSLTTSTQPVLEKILDLLEHQAMALNNVGFMHPAILSKVISLFVGGQFLTALHFDTSSFKKREL